MYSWVSFLLIQVDKYNFGHFPFDVSASSVATVSLKNKTSDVGMKPCQDGVNLNVNRTKTSQVLLSEAVTLIT